jgi:hypothetical protein
MGKEGLEKGELFVDRTHIDAEELKEIRNGSWSFDEVEQYAHEQDKILAELYKSSILPKNPEREQISSLCVDIVEKFLKDS